MKGNIGQLMKQAQMMQENMRRMQESLATLEVEGQSGAGLVKIQITGKYEVKRVSIDPSLVGDEREMLEDLVAAAFNDAERKVEATIDEKMSGMMTEALSGRSFRSLTTKWSGRGRRVNAATPVHDPLERVVRRPHLG